MAAMSILRMSIFSLCRYVYSVPVPVFTRFYGHLCRNGKLPRGVNKLGDFTTRAGNKVWTRGECWLVFARTAIFIPIKSLARLIWHNLLNECQRWMNNLMCLYCPRKVDQYKPNMESPDARRSKRSNFRAQSERPIRVKVQTIII